MRAWLIDTLGQPARQAILPDPLPGPGEVRLRIAAAGLNFADLLMAEGRYQDRPALPFIPGLECAGVIDRLGPGTAGPAPGTRVAASVAQGAFADVLCLPASRVQTVPDSLSLPQAAAFQIAYGTAHLALARKAALQPGETLFVTGAAGGVGLTAVEIGALLGARVIASARGAARLAVAQAAGAHHLIDSDAPDLKEALRALGGVDVVYDTVGGPGFDAALRATRPEGRLLAIGFAGGTVPQIPANLLLVKNLTVSGLWYGAYPTFAPQVLADSLATLMDWMATGRLRPPAPTILPFGSLPDALARLRDRTATGKLVLTMDDA